MALTHAAQEILYLSPLQSEMGVDGDGHRVLLLCDNQYSIKIAQNPFFTSAASTSPYVITSFERG